MLLIIPIVLAVRYPYPQFQDIPNEVFLNEIVPNLDASSLSHLSGTSKLFRQRTKQSLYVLHQNHKFRKTYVLFNEARPNELLIEQELKAIDLGKVFQKETDRLYIKCKFLMFTSCMEVLEPYISSRALYFSNEDTRIQYKILLEYIVNETVTSEQLKDSLVINLRLDNTLLNFAITSESNNRIIKMLIDANANVDLADMTNTTPLMWAVYTRNIEIVKLLLAKKANVDFQDIRGWTALLEAVFIGNVEIVKLLLDANAKVNIRNNNLRSALWESVFIGNFQIVEMLLSAHANVDLQDKQGKSPLMKAVELQNTKIVEMLLSKNAKVNECDYLNQSALMIASKHGNQKIVKLLLNANADVNLKDSYGFTALNHAIQMNRYNVVNILRTFQSSD